MILPFDPVLLSVGPLAVWWSGALALLGLGLGVWLSVQTLEHQGLSRAVLLDALAWALPIGILGARLAYVLGWWQYYVGHADELWQLRLDGLALWGALLAGGLVARRRLRATTTPVGGRQVLEMVVPFVALGIAIGRIGEFLDGHGQGLPSTLPWATQYASALAATPDVGVPRHPAQIYDAIVLLVLSAVLMWWPKRLPEGSRLATFLIVYGATTIGLGSLRLDPSLLFGWQLEQLLAAVGVIVGLAIWLGMVRRSLGRRTRRSSRLHSEDGSIAGSAVATVAARTGQVGGEGGVAA